MASFAYVIFFHVISQSSTADTKVFFYYSQMLIVFFGPESQWLSWMSIFDFNISQTSSGFCVLPVTPMQRLLSGVVMPFFSVLQLAFVWMVHLMIGRACHHQRRAADAANVKAAAGFVKVATCWTKMMDKLALADPIGNHYLRTLLALFLFSCKIRHHITTYFQSGCLVHFLFFFILHVCVD
jgi:hypothetical protein